MKLDFTKCKTKEDVEEVFRKHTKQFKVLRETLNQKETKQK